jgi:hypothetical protein
MVQPLLLLVLVVVVRRKGLIQLLISDSTYK